MMRAIGNHIHAAVLRAVTAESGIDVADREKPILIVEEIRTVDWASATFVGGRHEFALRLEGRPNVVAAAIDRLVAGIESRDIPIAGQIVAEIGVTLGSENKRNINLVSKNLTVNVLTIID